MAQRYVASANERGSLRAGSVAAWLPAGSSQYDDNGILTELGEYLFTEDSGYILQEA